MLIVIKLLFCNWNEMYSTVGHVHFEPVSASMGTKIYL